MLQLQFSKIQASFGRRCTILEHRYRKHSFYSNLEYNFYRAVLNFIYYKASRSKERGIDCKRHTCVIITSLGLSCVCIIAMKIHHKKHIRLDEVNTHWHMLCFDVDDGVKGEGDFSFLTKHNDIKKRLKKVD